MTDKVTFKFEKFIVNYKSNLYFKIRISLKRFFSFSSEDDVSNQKQSEAKNIKAYKNKIFKILKSTKPVLLLFYL